MKQDSIRRYLILMICVLFVMQYSFAFGDLDEDFPPGSQLPHFTLPAPDSAQALKYLGLKTKESFTLSDVGAKMVLIEFLSALCPICHANAPLINRLYKVIQGDPGLAKEVKVIGIAVGNNQKQMEAYQKNFKVPFPIFPDEGYALTGPMGGVATPTLILATKDGKVLCTHQGGIQDFDGYLKDLRETIKKQ